MLSKTNQKSKKVRFSVLQKKPYVYLETCQISSMEHLAEWLLATNSFYKMLHRCIGASFKKNDSTSLGISVFGPF